MTGKFNDNDKRIMAEMIERFQLQIIETELELKVNFNMYGIDFTTINLVDMEILKHFRMFLWVKSFIALQISKYVVIIENPYFSTGTMIILFQKMAMELNSTISSVFFNMVESVYRNREMSAKLFIDWINAVNTSTAEMHGNNSPKQITAILNSYLELISMIDVGVILAIQKAKRMNLEFDAEKVIAEIYEQEKHDLENMEVIGNA